MFDELDKQNTGSAPAAPAAPGKTEDIFAEVDHSVKPEVFKPRPLGAPYETVVPPNDSWLKRKGLIFGALAGGLIIVAGGLLALKLMIKNNSSADLTTQGSTVEETIPVKTDQSATREINNSLSQPAAQSDSQATSTDMLDSDHDGLTDEEEDQFITDPNDADTDHDGLTDREEVKVYKTDPLKTDTDGDGYQDGDEVSGGYSPNGPGKLLEIN